MRKLIFAFLLAPLAFGQGSQLQKYTVATLPSATTYKTYTVQVIDGTTGTDCTAGGASGTSAHNVVCTAQYSGSAWVWGPVSSNYVLPQATTVTLGGIKPDGTTCTTTSGVLTCTGSGSGAATYITADGTGTPPTNYQVLTAGANVTLTPGTHTMTIASTGGGSSSTLNPNPATTAYVFYGDSRPIVVDDATYCQSDGYNSSLQSYLPAITSAVVSGGVATFTYTAAAAAPVTGNPLYLNGFTGTMAALNGHTVTVSGTGSGTFSASVTGLIADGSYTDSGTAPCSYNAPRHFQQSPLIVGHGKVVNASIGGGTTASMDSNFATLVAADPAVTAAITASSPIYLYLMAPTNDFNTGTCPTDSVLEGHMTSIMTKFHALAANAKVILIGPPPAVLGTGIPGCGTAVTLFRQMNQDLRQLYAQNPTNQSAGTYYDDYIDMTGLYQSMSSSMVGPGGIHWNKAGGAYMGQAAAVEAGIYQNKMDPTPSAYVYNYADQGANNIFNSGNATEETLQGSNNSGVGWYLQDIGSDPSTTQLGIYHHITFLSNTSGGVISFEGGGNTGTKYGVFPGSGGMLGFLNGTAFNATVDTALSRDSAGVMDLGNGTAGDKSGSLNLTNITVTGTCTGCGGGSGLSGMTTGQVGVAGSPTTITSSKAIAGSGSGLTSGPTSSTSGDVATFSGTSGQIQDSSVLLSSLALLASPTFTGVPAAPTATGGTNTTQLATTAFVQAAIAAAGTGAGIVTYSGPSLTFTGTQYFPIGGGATASTTETNVDIDAPAAVTIQNMTVQMSAAPGVGNSVVYTWRKNASSTVLTCTISGASATSCSDTTHSFTTASLDLLDIQTVTTGTVVGTPTVVMAAQVGIGTTGSVASFSGDGALLSNSASTGPVTATLANGAAHKFWGNNTGSPTTPSYSSIGAQDVSPQEYIAGGGTANAQTATLSPAATSLVAGLTLRWLPTAANTGATTMAVNGLTAKNLTKCGTTALVANDLTTAAVAIATYDGTQFQLLNPQATGCGSSGGSSPITNLCSAVTLTNATCASGVIVVTGGSSSVTISAIPSTYSLLKISFNGETSAATSQFLQLQANSDSGANYDYVNVSNTGNSSAQATAAAYICGISSSSSTSRMSPCVIEIPAYADTTFFKGGTGISGYWASGSGVLASNNYTWDWKSTSAITTLTFTPQSGNFVTGSKFYVYGFN